MESSEIFLYSLPVRGLINTGFTHWFLTVVVCEQLQLPIQPINSKSCLAYGEEFPVFGVCSALVNQNNFYYTLFFSTVRHLICCAIIGLDVLARHGTVLFKFVEGRLGWKFLIWLLLLKLTSLDQ